MGHLRHVTGTALRVMSGFVVDGRKLHEKLDKERFRYTISA